jgi:hypothetical protein
MNFLAMKILCKNIPFRIINDKKRSIKYTLNSRDLSQEYIDTTINIFRARRYKVSYSNNFNKITFSIR